MNHTPQNISQKIWNYALWLLNKRNYSTQKLYQKINEKYQINTTDWDKLHQKLLDYHLLDDLTYAKSWLNSKIGTSSIGQYKAISALKLKGIPHDIAHKAWQETGAPHSDIIAVINSRLVQYHKQSKFMQLNHHQKKQKITQFLIGRGFGFEEINDHLSDFTDFND